MAVLFLTPEILPAQTIVQVDPATTSALRGGTVTLTVSVNAVSNLLASHVALAFDNSKLEYTGATAGSFMPSGSFFQANLNGGTLSVDQSALELGPLTGGGTLFSVSFAALEAVDPAVVGLAAALRDPSNNAIPTTVRGARVTINNPVPRITGVTPASKTAGDSTFDLTVNGTDFVPTSAVQFKGTGRATTYVNATTLTATIPAADLLAAGAFPVSVVNPSPGGGTSSEALDLTVNPGSVDHFVFGTIAAQTAGTAFALTVVAQDFYGNTASGFAGSVRLSATAGTVSPAISDAFTNGALHQLVTVLTTGAARSIIADDGSGHAGTSNTFDVLSMPRLFVSADALVAAPGVVHPNTSWTTTPFDPNDWSFVGNPVVSVFVVPEPGMVFHSARITLDWDVTIMTLAGVEFGSTGAPNGLFGSGQTYAHAESFDQGLGLHTVTITATRTDGSDLSPARPGDYLARVDFHLLKPGYCPINVRATGFQRIPAIPVQVASEGGIVRAYLGDVSSGPAPEGELTGDGKVDFSDLVSWSNAYWSGVPGYAGGMTYYRVKDDFGPTQDGYVFSLPVVDAKIDFEDLVIFSIAYGLNSSGQLLKVAPPQKDLVQISLGEPVVSAAESRVSVKVSGAPGDVRAMRLELKGQFGAFVGAEKGPLLREYDTPVALMSRSEEGVVFVDLAVMGLDARGLNHQGEVLVLRFLGPTHVQLTKIDARNSANQPLSVTTVRREGEALPARYELLQNYPNPFNPSTTIGFALPQAGEVTLEVYDMLGQSVTTLLHGVKEAGFHQVRWNGLDANQRTVASGVFFYRLKAGAYTQVKSMVMLK
jgi:hypothetical protein